MEKSEIKAFIAKRCAKELKDGDVVNLGIGLPTMIPSYLPEGVELIIHAELGIVSAGATPKEGDANYDPYHVIDAGGGVASVAFGGGFIDSATNFGLIRGGHVDACFLGALEVDAQGNLANWIIPGKKMPGMGGAMDLCVGAKHCIICMEHTAKGNPKIFEKCRGVLTPVGVDTLIEESPFCMGKETIDGKQYLKMKPIHADFALLGTYKCDEYGNCWYKGTMRNFNVVMATAADTVIAECEYIVPVGDIEPENIHTYGMCVDYIVEGDRK